VALGIAAGTLIRRTIAALGLSLVGFIAVRQGVLHFLRPNYLAPLHLVTRFAGPGSTAGPGRTDWVLSSGWSDRLGHPLSDGTVFAICNPNTIVNKTSVFSCFAAHHIYGYTVYQPASRFWLFQGIETGIFAGLSAFLLALTVWWVRYRVT
jgi:hypothetical protein